MKRIGNRDLLKISELAKAAGVSPSTIHYYVQAGLLIPPVRTSPNMAYYDQGCIQEIRQIQELQNQKYLPLSVIKLLMQAKREGQGADHLLEMRSLMESVFHPLPNGTKSESFSRLELASASGLSEAVIDDLETRGFLVPSQTPQGSRYDDIDLRISQLFQKLAAIGVRTSDLDIFKPYIAALCAETRALHEMVHRLPDHEELPLLEMTKMINEFKQCLALRIYRQETLLFGEHLPEKEREEQEKIQ